VGGVAPKKYSSTCFEHPSVHPQEDLYMQFFDIYFMHPYKFAMAKAAFKKKRTLFTSTLDLELRKKLVKCYV